MSWQEFILALAAQSWPLALVIIVFIISIAARARGAGETGERPADLPRPAQAPVNANPAPPGNPPPGSTDIVGRYISWMDSEIRLFEDYERSKESMAWLATVAYVSGVLIVADHAADALRPSFSARAFLALAICIVGYFSAMFIHMQFCMRWKAASLQETLRLVRGLLAPSLDMSGFDTSVPVPPAVCCRRSYWPAFVDDIISKTDFPRSGKFNDWRLLKFWRWHQMDGAVRTEFPSYVILGVATVMAIRRLLIPAG